MTWDYEKALLQAKVTQLRDMDFLLEYADIPSIVNSEFKVISARHDANGIALTEQLFPDATVDELGIWKINGEHCVVFSLYWWQQVDAAIAGQ